MRSSRPRPPRGEPTPAERGYKALTETAFIPGFWKPSSVPNAWKQWGVEDEARELRRGVPRSLRPAPGPVSQRRPADGTAQDRLSCSTAGIGTDCMLCHGGSIFGKSYIGLGNSTLDIQALFEELAKADGQSRQAAVHVLERPRHQRGRMASASTCSASAIPT